MTTAVWRWFRGLALFSNSERDKTATAELTGGGDTSVPWETVYVAANRMEADIIRSHLEAEDIPVVLRGEALGGVYGLTTGPLAQVEVLVPAALVNRARQVLGADEADGHETDHV